MISRHQQKGTQSHKCPIKLTVGSPDNSFSDESPGPHTNSQNEIEGKPIGQVIMTHTLILLLVRSQVLVLVYIFLLNKKWMNGCIHLNFIYLLNENGIAIKSNAATGKWELKTPRRKEAIRKCFRAQQITELFGDRICWYSLSLDLCVCFHGIMQTNYTFW